MVRTGMLLERWGGGTLEPRGTQTIPRWPPGVGVFSTATRAPNAGRRTPDAGRRTPDAGRRTPDARPPSPAATPPTTRLPVPPDPGRSRSPAPSTVEAHG